MAKRNERNPGSPKRTQAARPTSGVYSKVLRWVAEQREKGSSEDDREFTMDWREARRRKVAAQASLAELELGIKQRKLVFIDDATKLWANQITNCRTRLLGIPSKLSPLVAVEVDPVKCQALIQEEIHQTLKELSEMEVAHP